MSVLIKGVDMPKGDVTSLLIEITREGVATCEVFRDDTADGHSEGWAVEIVEVEEPHGRLIDAGKLNADIIRELVSEATLSSAVIACAIIDKSPTIIEAEAGNGKE